MDLCPDASLPHATAIEEISNQIFIPSIRVSVLLIKRVLYVELLDISSHDCLCHLSFIFCVSVQQFLRAVRQRALDVVTDVVESDK